MIFINLLIIFLYSPCPLGPGYISEMLGTYTQCCQLPEHLNTGLLFRRPASGQNKGFVGLTLHIRLSYLPNSILSRQKEGETSTEKDIKSSDVENHYQSTALQRSVIHNYSK